MASELTLSSLREAVEAAMEAPGAGSSKVKVTVEGVHVAQSTALLSVLKLQSSDGHWDVLNLRRVATLASLEGFLQAIANGPLAILLGEPTSRPALALLDNYADYIKQMAGKVGGTFEQYAIRLGNDMIRPAETHRHRQLRVTDPEPEMIRATLEIRRRLDVFRSCQLTIAPADPSDTSDFDDHDEVMAQDGVLGVMTVITSFRKALMLVMDAPVLDHRVTVESIHWSHAAALLALLHFHACGGVRNLRRVINLASLDGLLQAIAYGLLRVLSADPTSIPALALLTIYAGHIKAAVGTVGGTFEEHASQLCDELMTHAETGSHCPHHLISIQDMVERTGDIRRRVARFRSLLLTVSVDSDSE